MNPNKFLLLLISSFVAIQISAATTIPAGTTLTLKTANTIYSRDAAGKQFQGQLLQGVGALPAGTKVVGIVQLPRVAIGSSTRPLTLKLTQVSVRGRMVPVETQAFEAENMTPWKGRRGVHVTGGAFVLPPGTTLQFRLARPISY